jgi:SAM-dependent methyltransferase
MSESKGTPVDVAQQTTGWYERYAQRHRGREMMAWSPDTVVHRLAGEVATLRALRAASRAVPLDAKTSRVLDVGCANGASMLTFLRLGFTPDNLHGLEIQAKEVADAKARYSAVHFIRGNAAEMPYDDGVFDLVFSRTMFIAITDDDLSRDIARDMLRVTRPGGGILIDDWIYSKPGSSEYRAMNWQRIARLFDVGRSTRYVTQYNGSLVPPLGRFVSRFVPSLYLLTARLLPFLVGLRSTLLLKAPTA